MRIRWHELAFVHTCGLDGTILGVLISCDGGITIKGVCATCGVEFEMEDTISDLIIKCAISDYQKHIDEEKENGYDLMNVVIKGKPQ